MRPPRNFQLYRAAAAYISIAAIGLILVVTGGTQFIDDEFLDTQFRVLRSLHPRSAPSQIVVIGIDDKSISEIPEPLTLWHHHLGAFLKATTTGRAAAVGIDIVLPDRGYESTTPGFDAALLAGIIVARKSAPLVLAVTVESDGTSRPIHPPFLAAAGPHGIGYALLPIDSDGVVRRFDERLGLGGSTVPAFAGQIARQLGFKPTNGLIDFSIGPYFEYVPLRTVLEWQRTTDKEKLLSVLSGKVVLLGSVLRFQDRIATPINLAGWERNVLDTPGVLVHAQVLRNILGQGLIRNLPAWQIALLCLIAAIVGLTSRRIRLAIVTAIVGGAAILAGSTGLLAYGWYLPPAAPLVTLGLAAGTRALYEATSQMLERKRLRRSFSGYVSPAVMEEILAGQLNPELGGASRFVCALFSDIRGYTTRSEGMTPQQIVAFLNEYFDEVVNLIHAHGGTVLSFMGDGVLAIFGAPKALRNPCAQAFAASQEILKHARHFADKSRAADQAPIDIGVGLHAGEAVVGHVGSASRHDYTAIGDVINVASRLEGLTKEVGFRLVCSSAVLEQLPSQSGVTPLGLQALKGHTPVAAHGYDQMK